MSLRDTACYTLTIAPSASDPDVAELVESVNGKTGPRYARVKENKDGEAYSAAIYDYLSGAKLASVGYASDKAKSRRLQLHGPDEDVTFDFTGKIVHSLTESKEWTFQFQGNKFRWTREVYGKDYICSLDRKPDPRVEICLARGADKAAPGRLQILHYNIDRFPEEITDLRGLETLLVATLMSLVDAADDRLAVKPPARPPISASSSSSSKGPAPPPLPERVITPEDFETENPNEIIVGLQGSIDEHVARAIHLLEDPSILFIVIRTKTAAAAQRALGVSLGVTRFRHREGMGELHQYVVEEDEVPPPEPKGPKVIKLDEEPRSALEPNWTPPPNIAIYLSTINLPDLAPSRRAQRKVSPSSAGKPPENPPPLPPKVPSPAAPATLQKPPPPSVSAGAASAESSRGSTFGKALSAISGRRGG